MTLGEGPQEACFQTIALGLRRIQRQRGVQLQRARSISLHPRVQGIEQPMGLAQRQRCGHAQGALRVGQQPIHGGIKIGDVVRHGVRLLRLWRITARGTWSACAGT
ncbi:hypothetical protein D3C81_1688650 [compost metagenome]